MPYPKDFLFGSATSAHQIEGGNIYSDWYAWEQIPGNIKDGTDSQIACNSWEQYEKDIALLKNTNQNAYRMSIEWAKIEPSRGKYNQHAIEHYKKVFQALQKNNIEVMVTLFHFTLPQWVSRQGGFTNPKTINDFKNFASKMVNTYHQQVDLWVTINEPTVYALKGYLQGDWCPGVKDPHKFVKVWKNLAKAHNIAYSAIKNKQPKAQVGIVLNYASYESSQNNFINKLATLTVRYFSNTLFTKQIINNTDFLGINYYMKFVIQPRLPLIKTGDAARSDFGWPLHPENIYQVVKESQVWGKPIYITENGLADQKDKYRPEFIKETLKWLGKAIDEGAPVKGYFHWSLLDNFEWAEGYSMKFGLHTIDRKPRKSAQVYADLIKKYQPD